MSDFNFGILAPIQDEPLGDTIRAFQDPIVHLSVAAEEKATQRNRSITKMLTGGTTQVD